METLFVYLINQNPKKRITFSAGFANTRPEIDRSIKLFLCLTRSTDPSPVRPTSTVSFSLHVNSKPNNFKAVILFNLATVRDCWANLENDDKHTGTYVQKWSNISHNLRWGWSHYHRPPNLKRISSTSRAYNCKEKLMNNNNNKKSRRRTPPKLVRPVQSFSMKRVYVRQVPT
jgi:hypothetical protein